MQIDLVINSRVQEPWGILTVQGEVDIYTSPKLKDAIVGLLDQGQSRLVVDLKDVEFIDSAGLGVLLGSLKRVREHQGEIVLVAARDPVLKLFSLTGLDRVFRIFPTVEEATTA